MTYEDPTGSFSTGGGAPAPTHGHGNASSNGLDWSDDADTNVLQPRHLPRSLITDSELDWDEHDEGSTELWNGPAELLRDERRSAGRANGAAAPGRPRLPEPTLTPNQARAVQPTAAEPGRGALKPGAVVNQGQGRTPQTGPQNRQRRGTLPPAQLAQGQRGAEPERQRRGTLPPAQLAAPNGHVRAPQQQPPHANGQRRGTLPPAQLAPSGPAHSGPPTQNGQRRGTLPPAKMGAAPQAPNGHAQPPRRTTPVPTAAEAAAVVHGLDPAVAALDPRRPATLVMHAPPRAPVPQTPQARPTPTPRQPLPAAEPAEEDAIEHLQEQLFEAMARARADQARAERAETRAQQAEARLQQAEARVEGLENRAQRAEAELTGSAERIQEAALQAQRAEGRARSGESRAQQAELRLRQLDQHLHQLESHVHQLRARTQEAEDIADGAAERIQDAETRAREATGRLKELETRATAAEERATEAEERAEEAEEQVQTLAMAQASASQAPLHHEDAHSAPALQQLREQVAQAYEHIRESELRADEMERRAQAAEQAARLAQSTLHLSDEVEHSRQKKPNKLHLVQSALLASTLSFGVGAYFALFVPLQKRAQTEAEARTQEAAQHSQAISTLQAQRDAEKRGLEAQNQELRSQLEAARVEKLSQDDGGNDRRSRRERIRAMETAAAADSSEPEVVPGTRSAKAIERRLRRSQRARAEGNADSGDSSETEKPAPRAASSRNGGNDPLDGL